MNEPKNETYWTIYNKQSKDYYLQSYLIPKPEFVLWTDKNNAKKFYGLFQNCIDVVHRLEALGFRVMIVRTEITVDQ